jgi:hypothetical protein
MSSEQITTLIAIVAFLAGASAVLKVRTMQNTIDQQGELIEVQDRRLSFQDVELDKAQVTIGQQQQQITVLTNTVNSADLIRSLDEHLATHHREAMKRMDRLHDDVMSAMREARRQ